MYIMSQNHKMLINSDNVKLFYIEETPEGVSLMAEVYKEFCLGTYDKLEHAELALEFIGYCLVSKNTHDKITQVPSRDELTAENCKNITDGVTPKDLKDLFERAMSLTDTKF